jgi:hypothetical protein
LSDENPISKLEAMLKDHERRIKSLEQRLGGGDPVAEKAPAPTVVRPVVAAPPASKTPSVRHFILEKAPTDDVQRTLVIGYFLEKHAEYKSFNAKDIEKGFVESREKVPGNVSDKVLKNVWKGTMMQVQEDKDGLKAYVLTNAGTKFVESGLKQTS